MITPRQKRIGRAGARSYRDLSRASYALCRVRQYARGAAHARGAQQCAAPPPAVMPPPAPARLQRGRRTVRALPYSAAALYIQRAVSYGSICSVSEPSRLAQRAGGSTPRRGIHGGAHAGVAGAGPFQQIVGASRRVCSDQTVLWTAAKGVISQSSAVSTLLHSVRANRSASATLPLPARRVCNL